MKPVSQIKKAFTEWQEKALMVIRERGIRIGVKNAKLVAMRQQEQKAFDKVMHLLNKYPYESKGGTSLFNNLGEDVLIDGKHPLRK